MTMAALLDLVVSTWLWLCCAIAMSVLWGLRGVFFFGLDTTVEVKSLQPASFRRRHPNWERFFQSAYQFIFNGVGSFAGWLCLYALAVRVQSRLPCLAGFSWGDVLLFVFALLGLTGHLPQAVVGFLGVFEKIGEKVAQKIIS